MQLTKNNYNALPILIMIITRASIQVRDSELLDYMASIYGGIPFNVMPNPTIVKVIKRKLLRPTVTRPVMDFKMKLGQHYARKELKFVTGGSGNQATALEEGNLYVFIKVGTYLDPYNNDGNDLYRWRASWGLQIRSIYKDS